MTKAERQEQRKARADRNRKNYEINRCGWSRTGPKIVADIPDRDHIKALLLDYVMPSPYINIKFMPVKRPFRRLVASWTVEQDQALQALVHGFITAPLRDNGGPYLFDD